MRRLACSLAATIGAMLTMVGCEAQRLGPGASYSEPALIGKVINQETKKPIEGALIYGHYATSSGTLAGGSKFGEHVKSFEAVTDANGKFKLDAWRTDKKISGQPNGKFPLIAVWKPGYGLEIQNLNTIAEFRPRSFVQAVGEAKVVNNVVDWTSVAFELKPAKTEMERYDALYNAGYPMMMVGECGWETYARGIAAMHGEWKLILKLAFPPEELDANGYSKGRYNHPNRTLRANQSDRTMRDQILDRWKQNTTTWSCKMPLDLLGAGK
jgi:hypothetical protein